MQKGEFSNIDELRRELLVTSKKLKKWIYPKQKQPTKFISESRSNIEKKEEKAIKDLLPLKFEIKSHLKPRKLSEINNNLAFYYNHVNKAFLTLKPRCTDFHYFPNNEQKDLTTNQFERQKEGKTFEHGDLKKRNKNSMYSTRCEIYEKLFKIPLNFNLRYAQLNQINKNQNNNNNKTGVYFRDQNSVKYKKDINLGETLPAPRTPTLKLNPENIFNNLKKKLLSVRKRHLSLVNSLLSDSIPKDKKVRLNSHIKQNQRHKLSSQIRYYPGINNSYKKQMGSNIAGDDTTISTIRNKGVHFDNKRELRKKCKSIMNKITLELDSFHHKGMERIELQASKISSRFSIIKKYKNNEKKELKSRIDKKRSM